MVVSGLKYAPLILLASNDGLRQLFPSVVHVDKLRARTSPQSGDSVHYSSPSISSSLTNNNVAGEMTFSARVSVPSCIVLLTLHINTPQPTEFFCFGIFCRHVLFLYGNVVVHVYCSLTFFELKRADVNVIAMRRRRLVCVQYL